MSEHECVNLIIAVKERCLKCIDKISRETRAVYINYRDIEIPRYDCGYDSLHYAAARGYSEELAILVKYFNSNICNRYTLTTPLHNASDAGYVDCIRILHKSGAKINKKDDQGWTALHGASFHGHVNCVKELLSYADIDVDVKNNNGKTPENLGNSEIKQVFRDHANFPHSKHCFY